MTDFAQHLPLTVISKLVGIPEAGRERMLEWAAAAFDSIGPANARTAAAGRCRWRCSTTAWRRPCRPARTRRLGAMVYDAADRGEVAAELCPA